MRGFEYNGDFPNNAQLEKRATLCRLDGYLLGISVRVDTACREDGKQTLLVAETELIAAPVEHLDIAGGRIVLKFDGAFYTFHASDPLTNRLIFWPLAVAVADVHEGQEHIAKFENEGGLVHPVHGRGSPTCTDRSCACHLPREDGGVIVQPRYHVSGPSVTRVNPNEDGGVNWPIGGDRPADAARVVGTSAGARDAKC